MSAREKMIWCVFAAGLVFLFLLSSTDLIIKEKVPEIYQISVVVDDTGDEYYGNFRKGMDAAAQKLQADVNFITLYEKDEKQQMDLVSREIKDGARAVILAPVDESRMIMELDAISPKSPIILLGSTAVNTSVAASLSIDRYEAGRRLGEEAAARENANVPVWLFTEGLSYSGNRDLYDGLRSALEEKGFTCRLIEKRGGTDSYRKAIEETVYPNKQEVVIIALDPEALSAAAGTIEGSSVYQKQVAGLYGVGSTASILNALDRGTIDGLIAWNEYDEGYMAVQCAVRAAKGVWSKERKTLEFFYIEAENLRDPAYERLLYPIE